MKHGESKNKNELVYNKMCKRRVQKINFCKRHVQKLFLFKLGVFQTFTSGGDFDWIKESNSYTIIWVISTATTLGA